MRAPVPFAIVLLLLLASGAVANHAAPKGARSLGGEGVPRGAAWLSLEADAFPERPVGQLERVEGAAGEDAWNLSTYGRIQTTIDVPETGIAWFDIRARGWHPEGMMNPHMHLLIDGIQRAEWDVRGDWLTYPQSVPLLAGRREVEVENFNNYRAGVADRVLVVDWVHVTTPTTEGATFVPAGGSVVVDAAQIHNSVTGQLERSTQARNDTMWYQWGVGCFSQLVVLEGSGAHTLVPRLKGNVHEGVGTRVQVSLDGKKLQERSVGDDWDETATRFTADAGSHVLEICYDNDEPGKKRNLWLDEFSVTSESAPPPPARAAPWRSAHGGALNERHAESAIDATSVRSAREAWTYASGRVTGTPAYDDGVVYFGDHQGKLHAVRASDGSKVWSVDHGAGIDSSVALDDENVYAGDMDGWLSARSRGDGALVWRVRADPVEGTHLYGSPVLHDGVLYTGVASEQTLLEFKGEQTFRGSVAAFDAADGRLRWRTYTQEEGGRGVSVWSTPAIDADLGLLYVGTGNSYGEPVGPLTDSIVALDLDDGALRWSYQATRNDAFNARGAPGPDRDFGASPLLFEAGGRTLVGDGDKGGTFFALDRASGALVWSAKADFRVEGVAAGQLEGFLGTASYHDGVVFAPTTARSMVHAIDAESGEILWATELNPLPTKYGDRMFGPSTAADGVILQGNAFGRVFALDAATGRVLLNASAGGAVQGGISLAGDRFFVPTVGKDLWTGPGSVRAFVVDGRAPPPTSSSTPTPSDGPPGPEGGGSFRDGVPLPAFTALLAISVAVALPAPPMSAAAASAPSARAHGAEIRAGATVAALTSTVISMPACGRQWIGNTPASGNV